MSTFQYLLVRHGQSVANQEGLLCGQDDSPLTERGVVQAKVLGDSLQTTGIRQLLCSTSTRARHTLKALQLTAPVELLPELTERHFGEWEGLNRATLRQGSAWNTAILSWTGHPPKGQTPREHALIALRCLMAYDEVNTLVVSHAGLIRTLLGLLDRQSPAEFLTRPVAHCCAITRQLTPGEWDRTYDYALNIGEKDGSTLSKSDRL